MVFKKGAEWKASGGNDKGRQPDFRVKLTQELVEKNWDDAQAIVTMLGSQARSGNQTSLKLYCTTVLPYFLVKAKVDIDITQQPSEQMTQEFKGLSAEQLEMIGKIISGESKDDL